MPFDNNSENFIIDPSSILEVVDGNALLNGGSDANHHHHMGHQHMEHQHMGHQHMGHQHDHGSHQHSHSDNILDLGNSDVKGTLEIVITLPDVPGADNAPDIEIVDEDAQKVINQIQSNDVSELSSSEDSEKSSDKKSSKKNEKWDWESKGASGFISWVKDRLDNVPKHSGMDTAGLERAISYLEKIDSEISKAMRLDLDGDLDANKIEEVRSTIDEGLERLQERLSKIKKSKKGGKKKVALQYEQDGFIKEAQKITGVQGVYVTVPLLVSRIARVCINGMVSAGHDIEDLFKRQASFYKLNDREQAEVMQLLSDMGYPLRQDRGFMPEDALEVSDSNGMDWAINYRG